MNLKSVKTMKETFDEMVTPNLIRGLVGIFIVGFISVGVMLPFACPCGSPPCSPQCPPEPTLIDNFFSHGWVLPALLVFLILLGPAIQ